VDPFLDGIFELLPNPPALSGGIARALENLAHLTKERKRAARSSSSFRRGSSFFHALNLRALFASLRRIFSSSDIIVPPS
jgi:hypothetical protein